MFIGRVSLTNSQIALYQILFVNQAVLSLHTQKVTIRFGASDLPPFFHGQKWLPWKDESDDSATVWLGEPLLQWKLSDLDDASWAKRTYEILKRFLAVARREMDILSFGQCSVLEWSTNDATSIKSQLGLATGHPDDLKSLADRCEPCLHAMMLCASSMPGDSGNSFMSSLITLAASLRDIGAEVDPNDLFSKFFFPIQNQTDGDDS